MTDISSTLASIDAATGCQQCEGPLGDSPSDSFCSDICQEAWHAARVEPLVGYREPSDIPAHVYNQQEIWSPETAAAFTGLLGRISGLPCPPCEVPTAFRATRLNVEAGEPHAHFQVRLDGSVWTRCESGWATIAESPTEVTYELSACSDHLDGFLEASGFEIHPWQHQVLHQVYGRHAHDLERAIGEAVAQDALEARRNRNTGPRQRRRAPSRIDPRRTR